MIHSVWAVSITKDLGGGKNVSLKYTIASYTLRE